MASLGAAPQWPLRCTALAPLALALPERFLYSGKLREENALPLVGKGAAIEFRFVCRELGHKRFVRFA